MSDTYKRYGAGETHRLDVSAVVAHRLEEELRQAVSVVVAWKELLSSQRSV